MSGEGEKEELPLVLSLEGIPPSILPFFNDGLLKKFRFLKPFDFPDIPINEFLTTHAQSVRALLCLGFTPINKELLNCLPSLGIVVATSAGTNHIDLIECRNRGIAVTNAGDAFSEDVADCAVGLLLDVLRGVSACDRYVRSGLWPVKGKFPLGHKLGGKRAGILGLGSIGSEVAKRLLSFGCSISYNSRKKKPSVAFPYYSNVHDLAANSDVLILCCALNDETWHIVNKDVLSALGKDGIVINLGRGALIDEKELVQSLVQGEIGGAGLDVFENEPQVPKELFKMDNVVLSPHCSVLTPESFVALRKLAAANLEAFFSNKPLLSPINYDETELETDTNISDETSSDEEDLDEYTIRSRIVAGLKTDHIRLTKRFDKRNMSTENTMDHDYFKDFKVFPRRSSRMKKSNSKYMH